MPNENPWRYWLEETPSTLFQSKIPGGTPSFTDYWRRQLSKVTGEYQGALGKQALSGQPPSLRFEDFLSKYPFSEEWWRLSPSQRGENTGAFAPSLQWRA